MNPLALSACGNHENGASRQNGPVASKPALKAMRSVYTLQSSGNSCDSTIQDPPLQ